MPFKPIMPFRRNNSSNTLERIVSALCYLTGGIAGIIYIIITRSANQSDFFRFHFLQSIILTVISVLASFAFQAFGVIIGPLVPSIIDFLGKILPGEVLAGILTGLSYLIGALFTAWSLLAVYGLIWALLGKFAEIPFISNLVRRQMR
jgi:uncharacterized membrane protein